MPDAAVGAPVTLPTDDAEFSLLRASLAARGLDPSAAPDAAERVILLMIDEFSRGTCRRGRAAVLNIVEGSDLEWMVPLNEQPAATLGQCKVNQECGGDSETKKKSGSLPHDKNDRSNTLDRLRDITGPHATGDEPDVLGSAYDLLDDISRPTVSIARECARTQAQDVAQRAPELTHEGSVFCALDGHAQGDCDSEVARHLFSLEMSEEVMAHAEQEELAWLLAREADSAECSRIESDLQARCCIW
jgi:hypothetical protein